MLTFAKDENTPALNKKVFTEAAKWIEKRGHFTPEMLKEEPAKAVIEETYRVINQAISSSITQETPEELTTALENNAFVFSGFKTYHSLSEVGLSLISQNGAIKPFNLFMEDVAKIDAKYNKNYLYAEYKHAVASSQMAVKWSDFEKDGDRYDLQYRTAADESVRAEHRPLHNITLPANDPFWFRFFAPNGWGCRCDVVQVRKNKYPISDSKACIQLGEDITEDPKKQMFRFNPGKEQRLFPKKHPYLPKGCGECKKTLLLSKGGARAAKCEVCSIVSQQAEQRILDKHRKEYDNYDTQWTKSYFNEKNGGYVVTHKTREVNKNTSKQDVSKFNKEYDMCKTLAQGGFRIEILREVSGVSSPDIRINGRLGELKRTGNHINIKDYANDAFDKKKAKVVVFQLDNETKKIHTELQEVKSENENRDVYYFFTKKETSIYKL